MGSGRIKAQKAPNESSLLQIKHNYRNRNIVSTYDLVVLSMNGARETPDQ